MLETGNRLVAFDGYQMEYDADGNLVRKFQMDAAGAVTYDQRLTWNSLGELVAVTTNGSTTSFGYNGWGQRVRKSAPGGTVRYLWDGDDLVAELDGAGELVREYVYYPGIDQPHSMRRSSDGAIFRYTQEQPGRVAGLVAQGNTAVNQYTLYTLGRGAGSGRSRWRSRCATPPASTMRRRSSTTYAPATTTR